MSTTSSVRVENVSRRGRRRPRLDSISAEFATGAHGVVGRNGSGKSTFFKILAGREKQDSGRVVFSDELAAVEVGYLPQSFIPPPSLTVRELVEYASFLQFGRSMSDNARAAIEAVDLAKLESSQVARMSGGEQRRAGIAAVLAPDPKVVVLDEPTAGLDPEQRSLLLDVVLRIKTNRIVLLSTHLASDVIDVCDSVCVLDAGKLVSIGPAHELVELGEGDAERGLVRKLQRGPKS